MSELLHPPLLVAGRVARAPARVNLIGDHTDYTGGLVLPMAIDRWTEVSVRATDDRLVVLDSDIEALPAVVPIDIEDPSALTPAWARYIGGVVAELRPAHGWVGRVSSTVPAGSGLSSSAALEVACALAIGGAPADPTLLAALCQRAEHRAVGVPSGIMDQLASMAGIAGHALMIDCHALSITPAPLPTDDEMAVVVVHSGQARTLAGSAYAERVAECRAAEAVIGPLRLAGAGDVVRIGDPTVRARARHVVTENARVRAFTAALGEGDTAEAGRLMNESHESLRRDYAVSTAVLDGLCERLRAVPGVFGARLTGAGFGGCVVAICRPGALDEGWRVRAVDGASVVES